MIWTIVFCVWFVLCLLLWAFFFGTSRSGEDFDSTLEDMRRKTFDEMGEK